jgi:hypothetical protein
VNNAREGIIPKTRTEKKKHSGVGPGRSWLAESGHETITCVHATVGDGRDRRGRPVCVVGTCFLLHRGA